MTNPSPPSLPVLGLSEVVSILTVLGSFLTVLFGQDWGVTQNAQGFAAFAVAIVPVGLGLSRAIKHKSLNEATAAVIVAQSQPSGLLTVTTDEPMTPPPSTFI